MLNATHCLAGYRLASDSELGGLTCSCNTDLEHIRNCEDDQRSILLTVRVLYYVCMCVHARAYVCTCVMCGVWCYMCMYV